MSYATDFGWAAEIAMEGTGDGGHRRHRGDRPAGKQ
jgi:hypothetical protein